MDSQRLQISYAGPAFSEEDQSWQDGLRPWVRQIRSWRWPFVMRCLLAAVIFPALALLLFWLHGESQGRDIINKHTVAETEAAHTASAATTQLAKQQPEARPHSVALIAPVDEQNNELLQDTTHVEHEATAVANTARIRSWSPDPEACERRPSDHAPVPTDGPVRVTVLIIRAKVTAYTAYDHRLTHPAWADGIVAWHPNGRKRRVDNHPYCLATDWEQFPPGATFIHVPGYMSKSFPRFPEQFRVVDDACGAARKSRKRGGQPIIDLRYRTRFSAINRKHGWGAKDMEVEVLYPEGLSIPRSLQPWLVRTETRVYQPDGSYRVE